MCSTLIIHNTQGLPRHHHQWTRDPEHPARGPPLLSLLTHTTISMPSPLPLPNRRTQPGRTTSSLNLVVTTWVGLQAPGKDVGKTVETVTVNLTRTVLQLMLIEKITTAQQTAVLYYSPASCFVLCVWVRYYNGQLMCGSLSSPDVWWPRASIMMPLASNATHVTRVCSLTHFEQ